MNDDTDGLDPLVGNPIPSWFLIVVALLFGFGLVWAGKKVFGAPIPFPKPSKPVLVRVTREMLVGDWAMYWGDTRYPISLLAGGRYDCRFSGSVQYTGSWGLDWEGRFWITESSRPQDPSSWQNYAIRLKPGTLAGNVEVGAPGVAFRLEKRQTVKVEQLKHLPKGTD